MLSTLINTPLLITLLVPLRRIQYQSHVTANFSAGPQIISLVSIRCQSLRRTLNNGAEQSGMELGLDETKHGTCRSMMVSPSN